MPFLGLGLHAMVALFFAIHAVRTRQEMYWLFILFAFPLLGSIVYFLAVFLPDSRLSGDLRRVSAVATRTLDPRREVREAMRLLDLTPTVHNRLRLANALVAVGDADTAAGHYEACLAGPFASDPDVLIGAARGRVLMGQGGAARELLEELRREHPNYQSETVSLLLGRAHALAGDNVAAERELRSAVERFGSVDARVEYAVWALDVGDFAAASEQEQEIDRRAKYWTSHARNLHQPSLQRLNRAIAAAHARR
jgi:hypothetical protein